MLTQYLSTIKVVSSENNLNFITSVCVSFVYTYVHVCVCIVCVYVRARVCVCIVCVYVRACVCVCRLCVRTCVPVCVCDQEREGRELRLSLTTIAIPTQPHPEASLSNHHKLKQLQQVCTHPSL